MTPVRLAPDKHAELIGAAAPSRLPDRIVLGTAQLGAPYGRERDKGLMSRDAAYAILDVAWALGIRTFDTAEVYGEAPGRLADWLDARGVRGEAQVVTKVRLADNSPDQTAQAIARFRGCAGVTLLTHGSVSPAAWLRFIEVCGAHGVEAGQSVYTPDEVRAALPLPGLRRLQVPGSVIDRRGWEARGDGPVPADFRSVLLQGVLLDQPARAEQRVSGGGAIAGIVRRAASAVGEPAAGLLIAAQLRRCRSDDRVVVGVDSADQLRALVCATHTPEPLVAEFTERVWHEAKMVITERLLDPRRW